MCERYWARLPAITRSDRASIIEDTEELRSAQWSTLCTALELWPGWHISWAYQLNEGIINKSQFRLSQDTLLARTRWAFCISESCTFHIDRDGIESRWNRSRIAVWFPNNFINGWLELWSCGIEPAIKNCQLSLECSLIRAELWRSSGMLCNTIKSAASLALHQQKWTTIALIAMRIVWATLADTFRLAWRSLLSRNTLDRYLIIIDVIMMPFWHSIRIRPFNRSGGKYFKSFERIAFSRTIMKDETLKFSDWISSNWRFQ